MLDYKNRCLWPSLSYFFLLTDVLLHTFAETQMFLSHRSCASTAYSKWDDIISARLSWPGLAWAGLGLCWLGLQARWRLRAGGVLREAQLQGSSSDQHRSAVLGWWGVQHCSGPARRTAELSANAADPGCR